MSPEDENPAAEEYEKMLSLEKASKELENKLKTSYSIPSISMFPAKADAYQYGTLVTDPEPKPEWTWQGGNYGAVTTTTADKSGPGGLPKSYFTNKSTEPQEAPIEGDPMIEAYSEKEKIEGQIAALQKQMNNCNAESCGSCDVLKDQVANLETGLASLEPTVFSELVRSGHPDTLKDIEDHKAHLGGKGDSLRRLSELGIPVPAWTIIPTDHCTETNGECMAYKLCDDLKEAVEDMTHDLFGHEKDPRLVSIRSGAPVSMPGMMETILNCGLNDITVKALAKQTNPDFAWDSYRRFVTQYATIVLGLNAAPFTAAYQQAQIVADSEFLPAKYSEGLVAYFRSKNMLIGKQFPQNVWSQLNRGVQAVWRSWNGDKAKAYRKIEDISDTLGTAVTVQNMVFGNLDETSGTGVYFTRNPSTGEPGAYGEWLQQAQGEDVVSGEFATRSIDELPTQHKKDMLAYGEGLCKEYGTEMDIEFTVEHDKLYILQARPAKMSPQATLRIVLDDYRDDKITPEDASVKISEIGPITASSGSGEGLFIGKGTPTSPGLVTGTVYKNLDDLKAANERGETTIFVSYNTSPDDIEAMDAADGIWTMQGGPTCHAAVTARGWGKPCVVGFDGEATFNSTSFTVAETDGEERFQFTYGEEVTINGGTGEIWATEDDEDE